MHSLHLLSNYVFPDKPFMIALGTSHVAGDCDGETLGPTSIKKTAYDRVANELGLEIVKIGMSGCTNQDLLQATNELAHYGFLNDNCKLFILEPRLGDRTVRVPIEAAIPDTFYTEQFDLPDDLELLKVHDYPIQKGNQFYANGIIEGWACAWPEKGGRRAPVIQQVGIDGRPGTVWSMAKPPEAITPAVRSFIDASAFYSHSPLDIFNSVTLIDSIRHIVEANNVKFKWQVISGTELRADYAKALLGPHSTLFDSFINIVDWELRKVNMDTIKCGCGHFNHAGHALWYKKTIEHLR